MKIHLEFQLHISPYLAQEGGIAAREEGFQTSQATLAMVAGGGSSGDGTPRTVGPFRLDLSLTTALGRLPLVQEGRGGDGRPFETGAVTYGGRTAADKREENPAEREGQGKRERRETEKKERRKELGLPTGPTP
ncbi:hypothetical protein ACLB2K_006883 [Fragaria x ananassa]